MRRARRNPVVWTMWFVTFLAIGMFFVQVALSFLGLSFARLEQAAATGAVLWACLAMILIGYWRRPRTVARGFEVNAKEAQPSQQSARQD